MRIWQPSTPTAPIARKKNKKPAPLKISPQVRKRFEDYLDKRKRKCWSWKGSCTSDGYGQFWLNDFKVVKAHRFAYEIYVRKLSAKERLKNICKGKTCMNPTCWQVSLPKRARGRR
ncbi:MAG: hypothetical protein KF713_05390 [Turneriella sp.]|nr:hypothetical protein [Turneriella sp.]